MNNSIGCVVLLALVVAAPGRVEASVPGEPPPIIELYTMGQGPFLVERFGHAALCVQHRGSRRDHLCYNYGTTDFGAPIALGWGFLRGRALFWVSVTDPRSMLAHYQYSDRTIWRQELPLTPAQAWAVADKLEHDALPENRDYLYHHFYDNCASRLRDILDDATGGALRADTERRPGPTFREYGREGFADETWLLVVSDFIMGRGGDVRPDLWQAMFLPDYLRTEVERRFGAPAQVLYERQGPPFASDPGGKGRGFILLLALFCAAPIVITRLLRRRERLGAALAAVPLTALGVLVWGLAIVSPLAEVRYNEALLVFVPTDLALAFLAAPRRRRYAQIRVIALLAVSLLVAVGVFRQPLWAPLLVALLPLLALAVPATERPAAAGESEEAGESEGAESEVPELSGRPAADRGA